jgi:hypothetical protein
MFSPATMRIVKMAISFMAMGESGWRYETYAVSPMASAAVIPGSSTRKHFHP